jgi:uncharacterized membrane protein YbhN (UPF0104 family)
MKGMIRLASIAIAALCFTSSDAFQKNNGKRFTVQNVKSAFIKSVTTAGIIAGMISGTPMPSVAAETSLASQLKVIQQKQTMSQKERADVSGSIFPGSPPSQQHLLKKYMCDCL